MASAFQDKNSTEETNMAFDELFPDYLNGDFFIFPLMVPCAHFVEGYLTKVQHDLSACLECVLAKEPPPGIKNFVTGDGEIVLSGIQKIKPSGGSPGKIILQHTAYTKGNNWKLKVKCNQPGDSITEWNNVMEVFPNATFEEKPTCIVLRIPSENISGSISFVVVGSCYDDDQNEVEVMHENEKKRGKCILGDLLHVAHSETPGSLTRTGIFGISSEGNQTSWTQAFLFDEPKGPKQHIIWIYFGQKPITKDECFVGECRIPFPEAGPHNVKLNVKTRHEGATCKPAIGVVDEVEAGATNVPQYLLYEINFGPSLTVSLELYLTYEDTTVMLPLTLETQETPGSLHTKDTSDEKEELKEIFDRFKEETIAFFQKQEPQGE